MPAPSLGAILGPFSSPEVEVFSLSLPKMQGAFTIALGVKVSIAFFQQFKDFIIKKQ